MSHGLEAAVPSPAEKLTTLNITKEQATDLKVGQSCRFEVVGEVKELRQCYNDKEQYEVVLKDAEVEAGDSKEEEAPEDAKDESKDEKTSYADMPKEDLKKLIMVKEVKE